MTDATAQPPLPDHLSTDPRSPHHVAAVFEHDIGIRFNGKERHDVEEYCISEGWIKVPAGKTLVRIASGANGPVRAGAEGAATFDKKGIDGLVNGIAAAMHREGAELAFTYQNEKLKGRVEAFYR